MNEGSLAGGTSTSELPGSWTSWLLDTGFSVCATGNAEGQGRAVPIPAPDHPLGSTALVLMLLRSLLTRWRLSLSRAIARLLTGTGSARSTLSTA